MNSHPRTQALGALAIALGVGVAAHPALAKRAPAKTPTVVVAPFQTTSPGDEYRWIGAALSESLADRLLSTDEANVFSQKQWAAVLRERDIAAKDVTGQPDAEAIARQLGADQVVFGRYTARWPDITIVATRFVVGNSEPASTVTLEGTLDDLVKLDKKLAKKLLGKDFKKAAKAPGPARSIVGWRALTRCREQLFLQSIGPRAKVWLPESLAKQALQECRKAKADDKKNANVLAYEALGMYLAGDKAKAIKQIKSVVKGKKRPYGWPDQIASFLYRQENDDAAARKVLETAIKRRPGLLHGRTTLGELLIAQGDLPGAAKVLEASLAQAPKQPWTLVQLGKVQSRMNNAEQAVKTTDRALELVPGDAVILMEKASRQIDDKKWTEAELTLREAMKNDPRLAAAYVRLGYVYLQTDQLALAHPILKKALYEADRESERRIKGYAHYDLAKLYARQNKPDAALTELSKAKGVGFADPATFTSDPDLAEVVKTDGFRQLFGTAADSNATEATNAPATSTPPTGGGPAPAGAAAPDAAAPKANAKAPEGTAPKSSAPKGAAPKGGDGG